MDIMRISHSVLSSDFVYTSAKPSAAAAAAPQWNNGVEEAEEVDEFLDFASVCQHCKEDDGGIVRLAHCRHVICLTCMKAPYMDQVDCPPLSWVCALLHVRAHIRLSTHSFLLLISFVAPWEVANDLFLPPLMYYIS